MKNWFKKKQNNFNFLNKRDNDKIHPTEHTEGQIRKIMGDRTYDLMERIKKSEAKIKLGRSLEGFRNDLDTFKELIHRGEYEMKSTKKDKRVVSSEMKHHIDSLIYLLRKYNVEIVTYDKTTLEPDKFAYSEDELYKTLYKKMGISSYFKWFQPKKWFKSFASSIKRLYFCIVNPKK